MHLTKASTHKTKGHVLYHDQNTIYKSIHSSLFHSEDQGISWKKKIRIPHHSMIDRIVFLHPWGSRLLRKGFHHLNLSNSGDLGLIYNKETLVIRDGEIIRQSDISGSRPLSWEIIDDEFVFGEYRSNPERSPIGIFAVSAKSALYKKLEMKGIRHIHGIYPDPYTKRVWISTGDEDDEAVLYISDSCFSRLEKVLYGSQQTRAVKLLFTEQYVYFGSDAPDEVNYLYRMDRSTRETERLCQVGSSVFHGTKIGDWLFFSTAIEPSKINVTKYAEVWASPNGDTWKCIFKFKKDFLPMKYFQYGQVFFPAGPGNEEDLWISPFATKFSGFSFRYNKTDVEKFYCGV